MGVRGHGVLPDRLLQGRQKWAKLRQQLCEKGPNKGS